VALMTLLIRQMLETGLISFTGHLVRANNLLNVSVEGVSRLATRAICPAAFIWKGESWRAHFAVLFVMVERNSHVFSSVCQLLYDSCCSDHNDGDNSAGESVQDRCSTLMLSPQDAEEALCLQENAQLRVLFGPLGSQKLLPMQRCLVRCLGFEVGGLNNAVPLAWLNLAKAQVSEAGLWKLWSTDRNPSTLPGGRQ